MTTSPLVADVSLEELWERVRERLDAADNRALGTVHVGKVDADEKPWANTNDGEEKVNLTLELKPDQLELNLTGWNTAQADALRDWLQSVRGDVAVNALPDYEVVAFKRRAFRKTPSGRPWWQSETVELLGSTPANSFNPGWVSRWKFGLGDPKEEKLAFHVRRAWPREEAESLGDELPAAVAAEVARLLPILREIWSAR